MRELGGDLIKELEKLGVPKVREMNALNEFYVNDKPRVDAWLLRKESEDAEETLSISRKALRISERALSKATMANIWAAIATLIAAIAMYIAYVAITKP